MNKRESTWRADFLSSLVVFMVALPLCVAIAQASGVPPEAGIITGIIGGIIVGTISGSPLLVSGPAAGLLVLVLDLVNTEVPSGEKLGMAGLGVAVFYAGVLQIIAAILRVGQWFRAVSPAVIHGMLAGIGLIIIAKQIHVLVDDKPADSVIQNIKSIPKAFEKAFLVDDPNSAYQIVDAAGHSPQHRTAALIGLLTIGVILGWKCFAPLRLRTIPAALIAVVVASLAAIPFIPGLKTVEVANNLLDKVTWIHLAPWEVWTHPAVIKGGLVIALIASAETLICAAAIDRRHSGPRTRYNQELAAQGFGNALCGCLGALPMTGVIVRSATNVDAGAKTRLSTMFHGVWLLLFVVVLPVLLTRIPMTSLAAILILTGYNLVQPRGVIGLWKTSKSEAIILVVTALTTVATDLLIGVFTGLALSVAKLVWTFAHLRIHVERDLDCRTASMRLDGAATFLRLPYLAEVLEKLPAGTHLHVDFTRLSYIDHACLELLVDWEKRHHATGGRLTIDWDSLHARFHSPRGERRSPSAEEHYDHEVIGV